MEVVVSHKVGMLPALETDVSGRAVPQLKADVLIVLPLTTHFSR